MAGVPTLHFETYRVPKNTKIIRHPLLRGLQRCSFSLLTHLHPPRLSTPLTGTNSSPTSLQRWLQTHRCWVCGCSEGTHLLKMEEMAEETREPLKRKKRETTRSL